MMDMEIIITERYVWFCYWVVESRQFICKEASSQPAADNLGSRGIQGVNALFVLSKPSQRKDEKNNEMKINDFGVLKSGMKKTLWYVWLEWHKGKNIFYSGS